LVQTGAGVQWQALENDLSNYIMSEECPHAHDRVTLRDRVGRASLRLPDQNDLTGGEPVFDLESAEVDTR
jgi:hypothetical protein